jgi:hypothetical protein
MWFVAMSKFVTRPSFTTLRTFLGASLLVALFSAGCAGGDDAPTNGGPQFIGEGEAACTAEEIDPLVACSAEPCEGMSGDPLNECMGDNCPESVFDVTQTCGECIIANLSSVDDIAQGCGAAVSEPSAPACTAAEMDPVVACAGEPCTSLSGDPLMECISENCPESVFEVSPDCGECIVLNQSSIEDVAACASEMQRATACSDAEMDPLVACSAEPCVDLAGDALMECMDENCPESVWEVSTQCAQCIIANQSSVDAIARACASAEAEEN